MATIFYLLSLLLSLLVVLHVRCRSADRRANDKKNGVEVKGAVVLMKKHVMDMTDLRASIVDRVYEFFGRRVSFQLVSATVGDPNDRNIGKVGEPGYLEGWITRIGSMASAEVQFAVSFNWDERQQGTPGAVIVKSSHRYEFYLKTLTLHGVPGGNGRMHFVCNSWVYPASKYSYDRIFFANDTYLPSNTPGPLRPYREDELRVLRGNGSYGRFQEHDRVYDYDVYNDLGDPSMGKEFERPALGGSEETPYPRRGRTGRPLTNGDYLPCDEYFGHLKYSDFVAFKLKSDTEVSVKGRGVEEFHSFEDVLSLYKGPLGMPGLISKIRDWIPFEFIKELLRTDGERLLSFPLPQVISNGTKRVTNQYSRTFEVSKHPSSLLSPVPWSYSTTQICTRLYDDDKPTWWATDKEFARQMLAGLHPVLIRAAEDKEIQEFKKYEEPTPKHMYQENNDGVNEENVDGWVFTSFSRNDDEDDNWRFFVLDHSYVKKYQEKIYELTSNIVYASKTLLYLEKDGTLTPKGILLTHSIGKEEYVKKYYFPAEEGVNGALWKLAKAFVAVSDSGYHQLISHWLYTHAVIEPFVIATNRQLSVMHPIYKLLKPHLRDTMNMNSLSRQILIHANGAIERNFYPGKFAMSLTSDAYKSWNLMDHALPADLCKRGIAVREGNEIRLLIEDYPYAVDGLEIWSAIETWVNEYCSIYYSDNFAVQSDTELQEWWKEIREVGHGDLGDKPWWPKMQTVRELTESLTIVIWLASAFHAALNFGQYAYGGFVPNHPTFIRRPMPNPEEYQELEKDPDAFLLKTITSKTQALSVMAVIEILSRHSSDEIYLGQRDDPEWTSDGEALQAFKRFHDELVRIEKDIELRNGDERLKNRRGQVKVPYTLLYPSTSDCDGVAGLTGKGIPNSVSV